MENTHRSAFLGLTPTEWLFVPLMLLGAIGIVSVFAWAIGSLG